MLKPGALVAAGARHYGIHQILDLDTVLAHDSQSGDVKRLTISELAPIFPQAETRPSSGAVDLARISDEAWKIAQERLSIICPLLATPRCTRAQATARARLASVTTATV